MREKVKPTKIEWVLWGMTAVFLCLLLGLYLHDRGSERHGVTVETEVSVPAEALAPEAVLLNLNTATAEELTDLPGIGEKLAERIVAYRTAHGAFASIEEVMAVSGIGEGKFSAIRERITVD